MDKEQVRGELRTIMAVVDDNFKADTPISDETGLREGLGLDSLQVTEMLFEIEERMNVKISDDEARNLKTVGDVVNLIASRKAE